MKNLILMVISFVAMGSMAQAGYVVDCQCPSDKTCASYKFEIEPSNSNYMVVRYGNGQGEVRILEGFPSKKMIIKNNQLSTEFMSLEGFVLALEDGEYSMPGREVSCQRK